MALTFVNTSVWVFGTGAVTPTLPTNTAVNDYVVISLVSKYDDAVLGGAPSGWDDLGTGVNTGRATGNDNGNLRTRFFGRIWQSGDSLPALSPTPNNVSGVHATTYRSETGSYNVQAVVGVDDTTGTPLTSGAQSLGIASGDIVHIDTHLNSDIAVFGTTTYTTTGATVTKTTNIADATTASGTDLRVRSERLAVTAGSTSSITASTALTGTTTNSVGTYHILRLREAPLPVIASESTAVSVDDIAAVVSAQLKRQNFNNTDGTTISVGNSSSSGDALDAVSISGTGATVTYSSTHALRGTAAARVAMPNWNNFGTLSLALPVALNNVYTQFYFKPISRPTEDAPVIAQYRNASGSTMADLRMGSNGTLSLRNSAGTTISTAPSGTIVLNSIYRVEVSIAYNGTGAVSTISYRIFDDTDTQVHFEAVPNQTVGNNGGMKSVAVGMITAQQLVTNFDVAFDELAISPNAIASIAPGPTNKTGSESTAISVADVASVDMGSTPIAGTESTAISVSDTAAIEKRFGSSDGAAISVADTSATEKRIAVTDTAAITITETSGKGSEFPGSDTSALSVTDTASVLVLVENGAASTVVEDFSGTPQINNHVEVSVDATTGNPAPSLASDGLNNWWYFTDPRFQVVGDFDISYDLNINPDGQAARDIANFGFWLSDVSTNPGTWDGYAFRLQTNANDGGWLSVSNGVHSTVPLARISNHSGALASGNGQVLLVNPNTWYRVRLVAVNGYVTATVTRLSDSALLLTSTADFATSGYSMPLQGTFGQKLDGAGSSSGHRWDNITLTDDTGETIALSVSESTSILKTFAVTDTTALTVTESTAIDSSLSRTDTAAITITEASGKGSEFPGTDTAALSVTETASILVTQTRTDTASLSVSDTRRIDMPASQFDQQFEDTSWTNMFGKQGQSLPVVTGGALVLPVNVTTASYSYAYTIAYLSLGDGESYTWETRHWPTAADDDDYYLQFSGFKTVDVFGGGIDVGIETIYSGDLNDVRFVTWTRTGSQVYVTLSDQYGTEIASSTPSSYVPATTFAYMESVGSNIGSNDTFEIERMFFGDAPVSGTPKTGTDTASLAITETATIEKFTTTTDSAALTITESQATDASSTRTDTAAITATDTSALFKTLTASDTASLAVTEVAGTANTQPGSETIAIGVTDTASILVTQTASDTSALTITDTRATAASFSVTDTVAISVAESVNYEISLSRTDTAAITVNDTNTSFITKEATDTASIAVTETGNTGGESEPFGQESTALGIVEQVSILVTQSRTDTSAISVSDASATFLSRAGTDSVALSVTETRAQSVSVSGTDSAAISIGDTASSFITLSRTDAASIAANDVSGFSTVGRPGAETTALAVTEQASILVTQGVSDTTAIILTDESSATQLLSISASDSLVISLSDAAVKAEGAATPMVYQNGQWVVGTVVIYSEGEWRPAPVKVHRSGLWM